MALRIRKGSIQPVNGTLGAITQTGVTFEFTVEEGRKRIKAIYRVLGIVAFPILGKLNCQCGPSTRMCAVALDARLRLLLGWLRISVREF